MGDMSNQCNKREACNGDKKASNDHQAVRSRWTPKPEQILILESVFNSGMVNPPKDETVRIRRLLENFGSVGDANVFYWFQNRRSRSRRRQRQIQANMEANNARNALHCDQSSNLYNSPGTNNTIIPLGSEFVGISGSNATASSIPAPFLIPSSLETLSDSASSTCLGGGFSSIGTVEGFLAHNQMGFQDIDDFLCTSDVTSDLQYQQPGGTGDQGGFVTVYINGIPTEVPRGPLNIWEMCGQDFFLVHSSGHPVPINEYGFSTCSLQHGGSYFLVVK